MDHDKSVSEAVEDLSYIWERDKEDYVLIRQGERFIIYDKTHRAINASEIEEANQKIWAKMIEAGVEILDDFPPNRRINLMKVWKLTKNLLR